MERNIHRVYDNYHTHIVEEGQKQSGTLLKQEVREDTVVILYFTHTLPHVYSGVSPNID